MSLSARESGGRCRLIHCVGRSSPSAGLYRTSSLLCLSSTHCRSLGRFRGSPNAGRPRGLRENLFQYRQRFAAVGVLGAVGLADDGQNALFGEPTCQNAQEARSQVVAQSSHVLEIEAERHASRKLVYILAAGTAAARVAPLKLRFVDRELTCHSRHPLRTHASGTKAHPAIECLRERCLSIDIRANSEAQSLGRPVARGTLRQKSARGSIDRRIVGVCRSSHRPVDRGAWAAARSQPARACRSVGIGPDRSGKAGGGSISAAH